MSGADGIDGPGLRYVGRMTASAAHEMKNVLAIINENAGLLADMAALAGRGGALDPARLERLAADLARQVQRADALVKNLHRLAHSGDAASATVDLGELVMLVCALGARLAYGRGRSLAPQPPPAPVTLTTDPLRLAALVWESIELALGGADRAELTAAAAAAAAGAVIRLGPCGPPPEPFPPVAIRQLAGALGAGIGYDARQRQLVLTLPLRWPCPGDDGTVSESPVQEIPKP